MTTPTIRAALEGLVAAYALCMGKYEEYWPDHLDGPMAAADGALKANPDADALAARPLLEQVAAMADCIGAQTVGQITAISNRAAAWLRENPPGQLVAIEPRGCPTPGACLCVEITPPAPEPGEVAAAILRLIDIAQFMQPGAEDRWAIENATTLLQQQQHLLKLACQELDNFMEQQAALAPAAPEPWEVKDVIDDLHRVANALSYEDLVDSAHTCRRAATLLQQQAAELAALRGVPVALEALARLYWWGGMREDYGYDSNVVLGVRHWIDGGMAGDLPRLPAWIADRCPPLPQAGEGEGL